MNKYHKHIKNLCRRHSITLITGKAYHSYINAKRLLFEQVIGNDAIPHPFFSTVHGRLVAAPIINNKITYFCALHEIGHIIRKQSPKEYNRVMSAFNLGKVTKYVIGDEYKASSIAIKLNQYATTAYFRQLASLNQLAYIAKYESDWKTKLKPPSLFHYLSFSKNKST